MLWLILGVFEREDDRRLVRQGETWGNARLFDITGGHSAAVDQGSPITTPFPEDKVACEEALMNIEEAGALQIDRPGPLEARPTKVTWAPRRVLVPLDGSPVAEAILPFVSRIARPLGLEITLLRVVPRIPPQVTEGTRPRIIDTQERLNQEAADYLRTIADRWSAGGLRVLTDVRVGDAATEIVSGAREGEADLIAMTTHGRSALARLFFGAVAEAVLRRASVPVFIARATEAGEGKKAA